MRLALVKVKRTILSQVWWHSWGERIREWWSKLKRIPDRWAFKVEDQLVYGKLCSDTVPRMLLSIL